MAKSLVSIVLIVAVVNCFHCSFHVKAACNLSSYLPGTQHSCNTENDSECCKSGQQYPQYRFSPLVTGQTRAHMTINSFRKGGDGGGPSECDGNYHADTEKVVALSTGWYNHDSRCLKHINIHVNGRTVQAKVVDECDSINGCDSDHDFQPPCANNLVYALRAVWNALGVPESQIGDLDITWSDAGFQSLYSICSLAALNNIKCY